MLDGRPTSTFPSQDSAAVRRRFAKIAARSFDGFAFIRALRRQPPERSGLIPAIAVSAHHEDFAQPVAL